MYKKLIVAGVVVCTAIGTSTLAAEEGGFGGKFRAGNRGAGAGVERKANRAEKQQRIQAKVQEHVQKRLEEKEQRKQQRAQEKQKLQNNAQKWVDKRQTIQALRIRHGIRKGYLTDEELAELEKQQKALADLEAQVLADGKLTAVEFEALRETLNLASRCIWAQKHDTEGEQMPVYVLGKNVFAKDDLTQKLANESLTPDEVRALLADLRRLIELKRKLATDDLSARERETLQGEFDELLNKYFVVRS
ncbi:MAG: hypothetical protein ACUVWX_01130 [Kiritimatiellia bacterium]